MKKTVNKTKNANDRKRKNPARRAGLRFRGLRDVKLKA